MSETRLPRLRSQRRPRTEEERERRRRRMRRRGRRAYIRSIYSLPSLATLGNAVCGFASMYVSTLDHGSRDRIADYFAEHNFVVAAYLIFLAMVFDALDGRLARFARHTTDFGGQLDSLSDAVSFGAAPAFLALQVFHHYHEVDSSPILGRMIWAIGALYMSCALLRLARFNVSNQHGEQHHFSFLGLPSPAAAGAVAAFVLMQQDLAEHNPSLASFCAWMLPLIVLGTGLLMVSAIRYPHLVNRYLRGRRSMGRIVAALIALLALVVVHRYALAIGTFGYALWGFTSWVYTRVRHRGMRVASAAAAPVTESARGPNGQPPAGIA